jgi:acyl carrier protein
METTAETPHNVKLALTAEQAQVVVQEWLQQYVGELLEIGPDDVDLDKPFDRYGLDSSAAVGMTGDLSAWIGADVDAAAAYDHPSIRQLSHAVVHDAKSSSRVLSNLAACR